MKFALLASGSKGNCFVLEDDKTLLVIDCGGTKKNIVNNFKELGISVDDVDGLLITHDHSDHIAQIKLFKDVSIYSPVEIDEIDTFEVRSNQSFTIGSLEIMPVALSHDAYNTMGYIINNGQEKLVYMTDTGYVNAKYFSLMDNCDYLVLESNHDVEMLMNSRRPAYLKQRICSDSGHLNNDDCSSIVEKVVGDKTKCVYLAHISQEANTRELALNTTYETLMHSGKHLHMNLCAAGQFELLRGGKDEEEVILGDCYRIIDC